jgi:hypothetical protein
MALKEQCAECGRTMRIKSRGMCGRCYEHNLAARKVRGVLIRPMTCTAADCSGRIHARELCRFHYQRAYRAGSFT